MTLKIHPLIIIVIMAIVAIILFGMIRSCNNTNRALTENKDLHDINDRLIKDSSEAHEREKGYQTALDLQNGLVDLWQNRYFAKDDTLKSANDRINALEARHVPITPNPDTTITTVPNGYIVDCEGCFTELDRDRDLVWRYKATSDSLLLELRNRIRLDSNRIAELNLSNNDLILTVKDALSGWKRTDSLSKPHWKLLFTLGTLWLPKINATTGGTVLPNGGGFGFGYQDKYNRIISAKYFSTEVGPVKQLDIFIPLSFRRRKY